ncbi:MAG: sulfide/dihydroorotate dehydrogenase-like FAD/NAD-binding protein [Phycisphaerae bacterium]|nr:sulfide/dihydroorotate dehydrogenase-like FAD/NAD-binding protein [Phycisphaerae bacterium]
MFEVVSNEVLAPKVHRLVLKVPRVAKTRQPGQFVIVRANDQSERIPLTIADADAKSGTITIIVQAIGPGTEEIVNTAAGQGLRDVAGPLGHPTHLEKWGKVVCVGGGVGTAVLYPLAAAAAKAGNEVTTIIGGRSEPFVILRNELAAFGEVLVTTEDGSLGTKGFVTAILQELLDDPARRPDAIFAVGPVPMMAAVVKIVPEEIPTLVSLNPIMVDGTGMCGGCRVTVGGEVKFACVDGPEFDGHAVDFKELMNRQATYTDNQHCRIGLDKK